MKGKRNGETERVENRERWRGERGIEREREERERWERGHKGGGHDCVVMLGGASGYGVRGPTALAELVGATATNATSRNMKTRERNSEL